MGDFSEAHGTSQACAAFQGMQSPKHFIAGADVVRARRPLPERATQLRHQFCRFFLEDRKKLRIYRVRGIDIVGILFAEVRRHHRALGHYFGRRCNQAHGWRNRFGGRRGQQIVGGPSILSLVILFVWQLLRFDQHDRLLSNSCSFCDFDAFAVKVGKVIAGRQDRVIELKLSQGTQQSRVRLLEEARSELVQ